jgi:hypothetical protein
VGRRGHARRALAADRDRSRSRSAQDLLTGAAEAALGQEVPIAFTIWKGLDFLKVLGVAAIALGLAAFAARASVRRVVRRTIVAHPAEASTRGRCARSTRARGSPPGSRTGSSDAT